MELPVAWGLDSFGSREMEVSTRGPELPQRDARSGPHEPLLLGSSQQKGLRQKGPPSLLLAMGLRR